MRASSPTARRAGRFVWSRSRPVAQPLEPMGWEPADTAYRAVISWVPLPAATVTFDPTDDEAAAGVYEQIHQRLASSGSSGTPSPYVRERTPGHLRSGSPYASGSTTASPASPCVRVLRADGSRCHTYRGVGDRLRGPRTRRGRRLCSSWSTSRGGSSSREPGQPPFGHRRRGAAGDLPGRAGATALPADRDPYGLAGEYTVPTRPRPAAKRVHAPEERLGP